MEPGKWQCPKCKQSVVTHVKTYIPVCSNPKKHTTSPCEMERVK